MSLKPVFDPSYMDLNKVGLLYIHSLHLKPPFISITFLFLQWQPLLKGKKRSSESKRSGSWAKLTL
jgi:hypothetical protein